MRTARALTVSPSMLCARGVSAPGVVPDPGGGTWSRGVCSRGCTWSGGGVCSLLWGVDLVRYFPPPRDRQMPVNILPCPKLRLRAVITRMHSSRMRTARLFPISPTMHCSGGVPGPGGVPAQVLPPPSPMNRMTDRCKNITLPQTSFAGGNKKAFQLECPLANRVGPGGGSSL